MSAFCRNTYVFSESSEHSNYLCTTYESVFCDRGVSFQTVEHFLAYHKAECAGDNRMAEIILMTDNISLIKKFGESIINHDESKWQRIHFKILWRGNYLKFTQDRKLRNKLILTRGKRLVYANEQDPFYGNGTMPELNVVNPMYSQGFNILGFVLMDVRDQILFE